MNQSSQCTYRGRCVIPVTLFAQSQQWSIPKESKTAFIFNSNNIITKSYTVHGSIKTSLTCPFPSFHLLSSMTLSDSNYLAQPEVASSYSGGNSTNPSLPLFSTLVPCTTVESECRMIVGSLLNPGLASYISLSSEWIE